MPPIIVGIDGTSEDAFGSNTVSRNNNYDEVFANSFVRRICGTEPNTMYLRGPGYLPFNNGLLDAIHTGRDFILRKRLAGVNEPILLTGYSRGAAGAIVIARMLGFPQHKIAVEALLLFDCVNKDMRIDSDLIPDNVGYVLHVMRSDAANSRKSFGHSGTRPFPGSRTVYPRPKEFTCTHAGMGGVPWPLKPGDLPSHFISEGKSAYGGLPEERTYVTYLQDAIGAEEVQSYIKTFMREHGFPIPPDVSYSLQLLRQPTRT
ncbi:MAG TPA: hypothetical protein VJ302_17070 [Blastocatellia bacterium]|nr:hypothetical protein [Blastocatellia bacterium]